MLEWSLKAVPRGILPNAYFLLRKNISYHVELGYSSVPNPAGHHVLFLCLPVLTKTWSVPIFKAARHSDVSPRHTDPYASPPCRYLNVDSLPGEQTEGTVVTVREEACSSSWDMTEFYIVIFAYFIPKDVFSPAVSCLCSLQRFHFLHGGANEARSLINSQSCCFSLSLFYCSPHMTRSSWKKKEQHLIKGYLPLHILN